MKIKKEVLADIIKEARNAAPIEACGYLGGVDSQITTIYPLTNIDKSEEHFSFDPKEQFATVKSSREKGEKILAVYHSHPASPARPSVEDIKLAYDPNIFYIIASLNNNEEVVKGFWIKNGEVSIEELEVI